MKKILLGIFGLGLLAATGFELIRRKKKACYMEAIWVSDIPVHYGDEPEKTVTELADDVDRAIDEMDLTDEFNDVASEINEKITE